MGKRQQFPISPPWANPEVAPPSKTIASAFRREEKVGDSKSFSRSVNNQSAKTAVDDSQSHAKASSNMVKATCRRLRQNNTAEKVTSKIDCERGNRISDNHFLIRKTVILENLKFKLQKDRSEQSYLLDQVQ